VWIPQLRNNAEEQYVHHLFNLAFLCFIQFIFYILLIVETGKLDKKYHEHFPIRDTFQNKSEQLVSVQWLI